MPPLRPLSLPGASSMPRNLLIITPSWLGDLIMSQSLYRILREREPQCRITAYAPRFLHPLLQRMPQVDAILENPFAHGELRLRDRLREGRALTPQGFDEAFILANSIKSALVPFLARIPRRTAFIGEHRYLLINNMRRNPGDFPMMVQRYAALAFPRSEVRSGSDLQGRIPWPELTCRRDEQLARRLGLDPTRRYLILGPGANYGPAKQWPAPYFAQVSDFWIARGGEVIACGSPRDASIIADIASQLHGDASRFHDCSGQTSLSEAVDLLAFAAAAVCNDSGLMHVAAACGVPQVAIFGSTSTRYTPPLSPRALMLESDEPCHPCFERTCRFGTYACQWGIRPERAIEFLKTLPATN